MGLVPQRRNGTEKNTLLLSLEPSQPERITSGLQQTSICLSFTRHTSLQTTNSPKITESVPTQIYIKQMWWSGVVGVAGTQRRTRANKRPQQAANSSNKNLFCRPNQHEYNRHTQPNIARAAKKANKQCYRIVPLNNQISNICVSSALSNDIFRYNYVTN